ncbi:MAG: hypothetical protein HOG03_19570 [Desulfobacula sp.]|jgi:hypothetical protein|uniref:hypothetical protein n=1 Tax=Desulfobacula sp. TaxID=2593537 RepID=UPI001ED3A7D4|nr:hypothetical protein [Desulfobacula sp.]MBT4876942.1 hypothetical protein [Desulfobacula sp.]
MNDFFKKYNTTLKSMSLILMIAIPFFLYQGAMQDSDFQINLFLGLMVANMLFILKKG